MTGRNFRRAHGCLLAAGLLLTACGTPQPVLDLAKETAGNTAQVSIGLSNFTKISKQIADKRIDRISRLALVVGTEKIRFEMRLRVIKLSGNTTILKTYDTIRRESETALTAQDALIKADSDRRAAINATQKELKPDIKSINTISKNLLALSQRDSVKDRAKMTFAFLKSVRDDIAAARKASKAAQEKAEEKIKGQKMDAGKD